MPRRLWPLSTGPPTLGRYFKRLEEWTFLDGVYFMWVVLMTSGSLMWLAFMFMPMGNHEIVSEKTLAKRKAAKAKKAGGEAAAETSQVTLELAPVKENLTTI